MIIDGGHRENGLQHTCSTHRMTVVAFVAVDWHGREPCPFDGYRLHLIVKDRGRAMGIHKSQFL